MLVFREIKSSVILFDVLIHYKDKWDIAFYEREYELKPDGCCKDDGKLRYSTKNVIYLIYYDFA